MTSRSQVAAQRSTTMHGSTNDIPVAVELKAGKIRFVEWGGMNIELGTMTGRFEVDEYFKGLPDDRCQCPHWGYVIKGRMRFKYNSEEEVVDAGEAYYAEPGHLPVIDPGTEYVEFSAVSEIQKTLDVIGQNIEK